MVIQSWQTNPSTLASATTAGTLASVAADVEASAAAALQVPAVADYSKNGLLSSVVWAGLYRALQDGTTLRLISPDGTTVLQSPWSQVSHFSFDPSTSAVVLVTTSGGVASGQTITVQSDGFHFADFTPAITQPPPDPLFDADWYVAHYPQVLTSGLSPYEQYMTEGWKEGLDPNPFFSTSYYLTNNPDVAASGMNPLQHFEQYGWQEGRNPSASFDTGAYYRANPAMPSGTDPLANYLANLQSSGLSEISGLSLSFSNQVVSGNLTPAVLIPTSIPTSTASLVAATPASSKIQTTAAEPIASATTTEATPASTTSSDEVMRYFDTTTGTQFCTSSTNEENTIADQRPDLVKEGLAFHTIASNAASTDSVDVYRFFDKSNGAHFFTASATERDDLVSTSSNLVFEGTAFSELLTQDSTNDPVYRYFDANNGTHFYTSDQTEKGSIDRTRADLIFEGIAFYEPKT